MYSHAYVCGIYTLKATGKEMKRRTSTKPLSSKLKSFHHGGKVKFGGIFSVNFLQLSSVVVNYWEYKKVFKEFDSVDLLRGPPFEN